MGIRFDGIIQVLDEKSAKELSRLLDVSYAVEHTGHEYYPQLYIIHYEALKLSHDYNSLPTMEILDRDGKWKWVSLCLESDWDSYGPCEVRRGESWPEEEGLDDVCSYGIAVSLELH